MFPFKLRKDWFMNLVFWNGIMNIVCSVPECGAGLFFTGSFFLSTPVPALAPQEQAKTFSRHCSLSQRYICEKTCVSVYVDFVSAWLLIYAVSVSAYTCAITYLHKNKQFCKTVFACSHGAQVEFFDKKRVENLVTRPL